MSACSSSQVDEEGEEGVEDEIALEEAETDAVPEDSLEDFGEDTALDDGISEDELAEAKPEDFALDSTDQEALAQAEQATGAEPFLEAPAPEEQSLDQVQDPAYGAVPPAASAPFQGSGEYIDYSVQKGDTLMKIAFETYGDLYQWRRIYELNQDKLQNPQNISSGTVLKLERPSTPVNISRSGEAYLIRQGDTLGSISREVYGTTRKWKRLWENNPQLIKDPNRIFAGFYLYYTFTPEDEAEKMQSQGGGAPLAGSADLDRDPAAFSAPSEAVPEEESLEDQAPAGMEAPSETVPLEE